MQNAGWLTLLHRIPAAQHDNLMILTSIGTEIAVQGILRMEEEYLVVRGRVSGTTDTGRVFFIPYDQINCMGFLKVIKEKQVFAMYGEEGPPEKETVAETAAAPPAEPQPQAQPEPVATPPVEAAKPAEPGASGFNPEAHQPEAHQPQAPSKNNLLDRLRARRAASADKVAAN